MTPEQAQALQATLESMLENISVQRDILADLESLDKAEQELGSAMPPMLRHYLQRRSYAKALAFLKQEPVGD